MPPVVVLDTNALMLPFERRVRIDDELERLLGPARLVVPEAVLQELAQIAATARGRRQKAANAALSLAAKYEHVGSSGRGDAGVLAVARSLEAVLFTNDRDLLSRARADGLRTVRLRGLSHLVLDDPSG